MGLIILLFAIAFIGVLIYSFVRKRHGEQLPGSQANLLRTEEVFRDPSTNRLMRVWINPVDGKRVYVTEGQLPGNI